MIINTDLDLTDLSLQKCLKLSISVWENFSNDYHLSHRDRSFKTILQDSWKVEKEELIPLINAWDSIEIGDANLMQHKDKIDELRNEVKKLPKVKYIVHEIQTNLLNLDTFGKTLYLEKLTKLKESIHIPSHKLSLKIEYILSLDLQRLIPIWKSKLLDYDSTWGFLIYTLFLLRYRYELVSEIDNVFKKYPSTEPANPIPHTSPKLQWKGDKTDLAELVWALAQSGRINDPDTGQPIAQNKLVSQFELLFADLTLDVPGLMKGRMKSFKAIDDGETFTKILFELVNVRIETDLEKRRPRNR
jgi:hypothetical protein